MRPQVGERRTGRAWFTLQRVRIQMLSQMDLVRFCLHVQGEIFLRIDLNFGTAHIRHDYPSMPGIPSSTSFFNQRGYVTKSKEKSGAGNGVRNYSDTL